MNKLQIIGNLDVFSRILTQNFNEAITFQFPFAMKLAQIIPVLKSNEASIKENYRPVNTLPIL